MKLDMDLIREILLWCEKTLPDRNQSYLTCDLKLKDYTTDQINFHFHLLIQSGYIEAIDASTNSQPFEYFPKYLNLNGYEFLEAIKSDTVWNHMKVEAGKMGIQAIKLALPILTEIIARQAGLLP